MRFPIYESLYLLNRNLQETIDLLDHIQRCPHMAKGKFKAYQVEIECLRSEATQDVLEIMNDIEIHEAYKWDKQKKAYDDGRRDPDDIYLEVQERELQRRKEGLPPLIGILPRRPDETIAVSKDEKQEVAKLRASTALVNARSVNKTSCSRDVAGKKAKKNTHLIITKARHRSDTR